MTIDHVEKWAEKAAILEAGGMPRQEAEETAARLVGWTPEPWILDALRKGEMERGHAFGRIE